MSSRLFWLFLAFITAAYLVFWFLLIGATATYSTPEAWLETLLKSEIRYATGLSLVTCTAAATFALLFAVPIGYLMARRHFPGKALLDAALDIPIVLPPMVVGLCLLIFFQTQIGKAIEEVIPFTYTIAGVILAQFVVAAAFAIRTVRGTFDHLSSRPEDVALTLGATRFQALWHIALPSAKRGLIAAFCIAWARSLGEFGPILVFAGATRHRTEVLPTTVWLELSVGNLESAVAVSLVMILIAIAVLGVVRASGERI
ncbi:ABC transporter permease [Prosthecobacter dejongeii]|uniref:Molybdate transport system permease protein n=1 Tax=Prosthecobacter dejongeii TaxID=48465 RepID=A0A7W7YQC2_9BACT|nr:ABC transporter permease [Prosthecobacter dejongeii]MBB5040404.1 molybdate transport system permease protein [Prosthecobacter dejongeii]